MVDPAGFEPATSSLQAKEPVSSPPARRRSGCKDYPGMSKVGEQSKTEEQAKPQDHAIRTRVTTALARPPPRYDSVPLFLRQKGLERRTRLLHHRQGGIPEATSGEQAMRLFFAEGLRTFTT
jgi:hypothetical protein